MLEGFLGSFMGGQGASLAQRAESGSSGTQLSPWTQGDIVVSYGAGAATSGDRTAPAPIAAMTPDFSVGLGTSITPAGAVAAQAATGLNPQTILIAGGIIGVALLWKLLR